MLRDELRQPLRKRTLGERLWARRPSALQAASGLALAAFIGLGLWLARTPAPFAGEPVLSVAVPALEEIRTASTSRPNDAPAGEAGAAPPPDTVAEDQELAVLPEEPVAIETETAIFVAPRRSLPPAPIAGVSEEGPYGPLPRIGSGNKRPSEVYARKTPEGILRSGLPKIAIVLGGMGINEALTAKAIKELPGDVTFAFAPYGENLQPLVNKARAAGHEILLQLPMEPLGYPGANPGPRTLLAGAETNANLDALAWHMGRFAGYAGVMNYMGARFLSEPAAARPVLSELKQRGLLYLDDTPPGQSKAREIGKSLGLKVRETSAVIDAAADAESILRALEELEDKARSEGFAVGSGAGLGITIETVAQWARTLGDKGIALVPVSAAYRGPAG